VILTSHQKAELEGIIAAKAKEIVYLKRALESVYSRFHASAQESDVGQDVHRHAESEVDVLSMTNHTIEGLAKKEEEIKLLQETVTNLKAQLLNGRSLPLDTSVLEKQFKARVAPPPPPPPPVKPKKPVSNVTDLKVTEGSSASLPSRELTPPVEGHQSQEVS
jgi:diaphanous 1